MSVDVHDCLRNRQQHVLFGRVARAHGGHMLIMVGEFLQRIQEDIFTLAHEVEESLAFSDELASDLN